MSTAVSDAPIMSVSITRPPGSNDDFVRIVGDVDITNSDALAAAADELIEADGDVVYVDLGPTTFMGATLAAFLGHLARARGQRRRYTLVLCRPSRLARKVIDITGLPAVAQVLPDLPASWPDDSRA